MAVLTDQSPWTRLGVVAVYAVAMAVVEASVVYYLRKLFALQYTASFTSGRFRFPPAYLRHEQVRELATIVMLLVVAYLAGRGRGLSDTPGDVPGAFGGAGQEEARLRGLSALPRVGGLKKPVRG